MGQPLVQSRQSKEEEVGALAGFHVCWGRFQPGHGGRETSLAAGGTPGLQWSEQRDLLKGGSASGDEGLGRDERTVKEQLALVEVEIKRLVRVELL